MGKYIDVEKLKAEIERRKDVHRKNYEEFKDERFINDECEDDRILSLVASLQQEPSFPQYDNIVDKVFGAGNLESFEHDEAEMLVALAKEELLKSFQPEAVIKSPFTGGKVVILSREEEATFRGEKVKITRKYYRCVDTGREFTDGKLDDDMMWAVFRAYCEKKGFNSFNDLLPE